MQIPKILDVILIVILLSTLVALALYKLLLLLRYRNDPAKREALISTGQVFPKRLAKFLFDEDAGTSGSKGSPPNSSHK